MNFRRCISLIALCAVLLSGIGIMPSYAFEERAVFSGMKKPELVDSSFDVRNSVSELKTVVDLALLKDVIMEAVICCEESVELSFLEIPEAMGAYIADFIWYNLPEAFGVEKIGYYTLHGDVLSLILTYRDFADTKNEYELCLSKFINAADSMLQGIEGNTALDDVKKALLLHDRLAAEIEYDYTSASVIKHTAYGAFVKKAAVCQGYAMAYMYLLQRVGIENYYCSSQKLNHGWNIVYINSKPYHVDVTWDDASWYPDNKGIEGRVEHDNFLRSTAGIISTGHEANDFDSIPSDTLYDNAFWQNSSAQFILIENEIYYIDSVNEELKRYSDGKKLWDVTGEWRASETSYWMGNFSCLSASGNDLLYSLPDGIYKYSLEKSSSEKIFSPTMKKNYSVFGFRYFEGYLLCEINNAPYNSTNISRIKEPYTETSVVPSHIEINTYPQKTVYYLGDSFDEKGLSLKMVYSDETEEIISSGFSVSGFSSDSSGKKTVLVSYNGYNITFYVSVKEPEVTLSESAVSLKQFEEITLIANALPENAEVKWLSSRPQVVSVKNGVCKAIGMGESVITAKITYNSKEYTASCVISVSCAHRDTEKHSEIPATCKKTGLTKGIYCNSCKKYISGREIIPIDTNAHKWDEGTVIYKASCISIGQTKFTCLNDSSHSFYENYDKDPNVHNHTSAQPEEKADYGKVGYTAGVFCHSCLKYISGHEEIPALIAKIDETKSIKTKEEFVLSVSGVTVGELLSVSSEGTYIRNMNGQSTLPEENIATGMTLFLPDGNRFAVVIFGDVDGNGAVSAADARFALRASVGLENFSPEDAVYLAADVDSNAKITASDARLILRASVGLEDSKKFIDIIK